MLGRHSMRWVLGTTLLALLGCGHSAFATIGFKSAVNYPVGKNPVAVAYGDFDGDGKIDLAVVNGGDASIGDNGGVSILLGNGDGTFRAALNIPAGKNPTSIVAADFNGDGWIDLAVINNDGGVGNVGILLGNGDRTFQLPVDYGTGTGPNMVKGLWAKHVAAPIKHRARVSTIVLVFLLIEKQILSSRRVTSTILCHFPPVVRRNNDT
jgi:FG-GAP-like repeat